MKDEFHVSPGLGGTSGSGIYNSLIRLLGLEQELATTIPLNRLIEADELADAVMFLASNESTYLTGSEIVVDGGSTGSPLGAPAHDKFR